MSRISQALLNPDWKSQKKVALDLGEGQFDSEGKPTVLHEGHVISAYEFIGTPWFCGYVGDSMGNQIRRRFAYDNR
jgi:hypothetical protein